MLHFINKHRGLIMFFAMAWLMVACNEAPPPPEIAPAPLAPMPTVTPSVITTTATITSSSKVTTTAAEAIIPAESEKLLNLAKNDLATKQNVSINDITLISIKAVDWPDASLDCPEDGMMYAQVVTPGYLIELSVSGQSYPYHTDKQATVVTCKP